MTQRSAELSGQDRILRFVKDALNRQANPDAPAPPIMLVIGPRGSGKTGLVDHLDARHRGSSPIARIDFAGNPNATPAQVMLAAGRMLSERVPRVGRANFTLLAMGISAITLRLDGQGSPAGQLAARLRQGGVSGQSAANLAAHAAKLLPAAEQQAMLTEAGAAVGWLMDGIRERRLNKGLDWYASNVELGGDGTRIGPLLALHDKWRTAVDEDDPEVRRDALGAVWRTLCGALLADLRVFPKAGLSHGARTTNCLLLLDNADAGAGRDFLESLAEVRQKAAGDTDPLVVVAAHGTRPRLQPGIGPPVLSTDEGLTYQDWLQAARHQRLSPWYPVRLASLSRADVMGMVDSHVLRTARNDTEFVLEITGGHLSGVQELASLLSDKGLVEPGMADALLAVVRPGGLSDDDLNAMAIFSATLPSHLGAVDSVYKSLGWRVKAIGMRERLLDVMWAVEEADGVEIRPLYRVLLANWLARDVDLWERAHEGFCAHYGARDPVAQHYHLLSLTSLAATSNARKVAEYLCEQLERPDVRLREWNATVKTVTTAPNRLRRADADRRALVGGAPGLPPDPREAVSLLAGTSEEGRRARIAARIVAARWLFNDRFLDPKRKTAQVLGDEYEKLAALTLGDSDVLYAEATYFRKIASDWENSW